MSWNEKRFVSERHITKDGDGNCDLSIDRETQWELKPTGVSMTSSPVIILEELAAAALSGVFCGKETEQERNTKRKFLESSEVSL
jgi:hypothetical protein